MNILQILIPVKELKEFNALADSAQKKAQETAQLLQFNGHILSSLKRHPRRDTHNSH